MNSRFLLIIILTSIISCVRDSTCDCYKKKGCVLIYAIQIDSNQYIAEKSRFCPTGDFEKDTGYRVIVKAMRMKYDSISKITKTKFYIGYKDSIKYDTIRIKGFQLSEYRIKGYTYKCWD